MEITPSLQLGHVPQHVGSLYGLVPLRRALALQLGHVPQHVERTSHSNSPAELNALQLGHVPQHVERKQCGSLPDCWSIRFNWATYLSTWKGGCANQGSPARSRFNWATYLSTWKAYVRIGAYTGDAGFNWATYLSTWKGRGESLELVEEALASIGPRTSARGKETVSDQ